MIQTKKQEGLDDTMLMVFTDRIRRAEREGRRATKAELLEGLDEETEARRAASQVKALASADLDRFKEYVRDFCAASGLAQLSLWAEETNGRIEVKVMAQAKSSA